MQYYRRGSLARAMRTLWYQDLTDVQRLRYGVQVSWVGCGQQQQLLLLLFGSPPMQSTRLLLLFGSPPMQSC
jgi:hypothetical protein